MNARLPILFATLALAACGGDPADQPMTNAVDAGSEASNAAEATPAVQNGAMPAAAAQSTLAIDGEGLRLFAADTGSARPIPFGTPMAQALDIVTRARGAGPRDTAVNADCGNVTVATWADGLSLNFAGDKFVGWGLSSAASGLTTASNVGVGATRSDLTDAYAAEISQTTLGTEFSAGGFAGLLASAAADARITDMWAGQTCIAR